MSEDKKEAKAKKKFMESTVRKRKKNEKSNTQRFLPFSEIKNDTVLLKNGGLRAVLQIEPLNFNLKSETEQQGIITGYESFLNTLFFPLQIIMRSTKVNIEPYLDHIQEKAKGQKNMLLKDQTLAYANFVERIVEVADIMQKQFYIIIPLDDGVKSKGGQNTPLSQFFSWMNVDDTLSKALQRNQKLSGQLSRLKERVDLVETGLRNIGLAPRRLQTLELIQLYYKMYNQHQSQTQKLAQDGNFNTSMEVL